MKRLLAVAVGLIFLVGCATIPDTPSWFPAPDKPSGPKVAAVGQKVKYETEGTDPLDVHEFQWQFGSEESDWDSDGETIKHTYKLPGTYEVRVRERCPLKLFQSGWSDARTTIVTAPAEKAPLLKRLWP